MNEKQISVGLSIFNPDNFDESFKRMPLELQEKSIALNRAFKRASRAVKQFALWRREHEAAEAALKIAQADHGDVLNRWNPDTNTLETLDDAPKADAS